MKFQTIVSERRCAHCGRPGGTAAFPWIIRWAKENAIDLVEDASPYLHAPTCVAALVHKLRESCHASA